MDKVLFITLIVNTIISILLYLHSSQFYKVLVRFMLRNLAMSAECHKDIEMLVKMQGTKIKELDLPTKDKIEMYLKASFYKKFEVTYREKSEIKYKIKIEGVGTGMPYLEPVELDYLSEIIQDNYVVAYHKIGENKPSKVIVVRKEN